MTHEAIGQVDLGVVLSSYHKLAKNITWNESDKGKQCGLQFIEGEDPFISCTGRLKENKKESDYELINPLFKGTVFESLIKQYKLYRTRLMWVDPLGCYSIHQDQTQRIHIPLITNKHCLFVFPDISELIYLQTGKVYKVDTRKKHSFVNFSNAPRLHLVGCVMD